MLQSLEAFSSPCSPSRGSFLSCLPLRETQGSHDSRDQPYPSPSLLPCPSFPAHNCAGLRVPSSLNGSRPSPLLPAPDPWQMLHKEWSVYAQSVGPGQARLNSSSATNRLHDLGQITESRWASVFPSVKWSMLLSSQDVTVPAPTGPPRPKLGKQPGPSRAGAGRLRGARCPHPLGSGRPKDPAPPPSSPSPPSSGSLRGPRPATPAHPHNY